MNNAGGDQGQWCTNGLTPWKNYVPCQLTTWCSFWATWQIFIHKEYLNAWTNLRSEFPTKKHRKNVHINVCLQHLVFKVQPNVLTSVFYIFICGTLRSPGVLSCNSKWTGTSTHFWSLSNHIQLPCDLWKGGTVHGQMCPYMHWIRCSTFSAFVVKCDLINNTNSTVTKLGTWMRNVSCEL